MIFIHSTVDGSWFAFQFQAIITKSAENIFFWYIFGVYLVIQLGVKLLGLRICICLAVVENYKEFSKVALQTYIPISSVC